MDVDGSFSVLDSYNLNFLYDDLTQKKSADGDPAAHMNNVEVALINVGSLCEL